MTSSAGGADSLSTESLPPLPPRAIVAGHGAFPEGMVSAVQQITGFGDVFVAMSNAGLSGEDIEARLRARAAELHVKVFFTDLPGGSATMAARRMMRDTDGIVLVTGANLATLLEFVFRGDERPGEAARHAAEKGRAAIVVQGED
jgi:N-acetylgalactosamine PTS system EIIA component